MDYMDSPGGSGHVTEWIKKTTQTDLVLTQSLLYSHYFASLIFIM